MPRELTLATLTRTTPPAILIEGFPGAGKTTLALQFPAPWLINCDLNEEGPLFYLKSVNRFPTTLKISDIPYYDDHTKAHPHLVEPENRFDRLITEVQKAIADPDTQTLIIDSMSTVDTFIYNKVQKQCGVKTGEPMKIQHWRPFRDYLMTLIGLIRYCGKTVIVCCHVESINDEPAPGQMSKIIGYKPMISTKVGEQFAGFFTDMWMMKALPEPGGKIKTILTTTRTAKFDDLKNAYQMPGEIVNPTYEEINKYLKQ